VNGDSLLDLVIPNSAARACPFFSETPRNLCAACGLLRGIRPYVVAIADFNLDTRPDLAVSNAGQNSFPFCWETAMGHSASTPFRLERTLRPEAMDANRDGRPTSPWLLQHRRRLRPAGDGRGFTRTDYLRALSAGLAIGTWTRWLRRPRRGNSTMATTCRSCAVVKTAVRIEGRLPTPAHPYRAALGT